MCVCKTLHHVAPAADESTSTSWPFSGTSTMSVALSSCLSASKQWSAKWQDMQAENEKRLSLTLSHTVFQRICHCDIENLSKHPPNC